MSLASIPGEEPSWQSQLDGSVAARILDEVLAARGVARTELAQRLGVSGPTLSKAIEALEDLGVITVTEGKNDGVPGRRPSIVRATPTAADTPTLLALRIEPVDVSRLLGKTKEARLVVYLVGLDGQVISKMAEVKVPKHEAAVVESAQSLACEAIGKTIEMRHAAPLAIGVEIGGHVNGRGVAGVVRGEVLRSPNLGWDRPLELAARLQRATRLTTVAENDVNAIARYEHWFGLGRAEDDYVTVMVGDGIGGALFANRALAHGAKGMAGEIGHNQVASTVAEQELECWCGKKGCLDAIASGYGIARRIGNGEKPDDVYLSAGQAIGRTLAILINTVDPFRVILSGKVWWSSELLQEAAIETMRSGVFRGIDGVERIVERSEAEGRFWPRATDAAEAEWQALATFSGDRNVVPLFLCHRSESAGSAGAAIAALIERIAS